MLKIALLVLSGIIACQATLGDEEFQKRCALLSGIRNTMANLLGGGGVGGIGINQPPQFYTNPYQYQYQYPYQYQQDYYYYYPEYEYIYVDYPPMLEYQNGYYGNPNNGYYQVIQMDDQMFYNDPYYSGEGPYYIYRELHDDKDYYFTNRKVDNKIQKIGISKRAFEDLSKRNETIRKRILEQRAGSQQQPQPQPQQGTRPASNIQMIPIPVRPGQQQAPNVPVTPLGARPAPQPTLQQIPANMVMGRPQMVPQRAVMMRAPPS